MRAIASPISGPIAIVAQRVGGVVAQDADLPSLRHLASLARKKEGPQMRWQLQDAKNQLSKLVQEAQRNGPQIITLHGKPAVAVISIDEFEKRQSKQPNLLEYLQSSPEWDDEFIEFVNDRSGSPDRDVEF